MDARMQEIQEKEQRLQELQAERETGIQLGQDNHVFTLTDSINAISSRLNELYAELDQEAAAQVRIQAQEEKIESEPIPFAVSGIDLTELDPDLARIIEIVTKADRRIQAEGHNTEIQKLIDSNREDARAASERELQLKRQNDELQKDNNELHKTLEGLAAANEKMAQETGQLILDKEDAESKRDAAMTELDGVKLAFQVAQEEIQQMRAAGHYGESKAQKVIDITPEETSEIQSLVSNLAKKLVSVNSIGGNWKEAVYDDGSKEVVHANYVDQLEAVAPPKVLGVSTFQPNQASDTHIQLDSGTAEQDAAAHQEVADQTFQVSSGHDMAETNSPVEMAGATIEEAFRRIEQLELTVYGQKAEVA